MFASDQVKIGIRASISSYYADARSERFFHEHRKLTASARSFIHAHPTLVGLGDDPVVMQLAVAAGFSPLDLVVMRVLSNGRHVTAIAVPTRVWRDADHRACLLSLKGEARGLLIRCILVPQRWVRAEVRGGVARVIAQARQTVYSPQQLRAVLEHLGVTKVSTLSATANVLPDHRDPYGAVLAMVIQGYVQVDRSNALGADSWIATARQRSSPRDGDPHGNSVEGGGRGPALSRRIPACDWCGGVPDRKVSDSS